MTLSAAACKSTRKLDPVASPSGPTVDQSAPCPGSFRFEGKDPCVYGVCLDGGGRETVRPLSCNTQISLLPHSYLTAFCSALFGIITWMPFAPFTTCVTRK